MYCHPSGNILPASNITLSSTVTLGRIFFNNLPCLILFENFMRKENLQNSQEFEKINTYNRGMDLDFNLACLKTYCLIITLTIQKLSTPFWREGNCWFLSFMQFWMQLKYKVWGSLVNGRTNFFMFNLAHPFLQIVVFKWIFQRFCITCIKMVKMCKNGACCFWTRFTNLWYNFLADW